VLGQRYQTVGQLGCQSNAAAALRLHQTGGKERCWVHCCCAAARYLPLRARSSAEQAAIVGLASVLPARSSSHLLTSD
jgi:hypothetical protein